MQCVPVFWNAEYGDTSRSRKDRRLVVERELRGEIGYGLSPSVEPGATEVGRLGVHEVVILSHRSVNQKAKGVNGRSIRTFSGPFGPA